MAAAKKRSKKATPIKKAATTRRTAAKGRVGLDTSRAWSLDEIERELTPVSAARVAAVRDAIVRAYGDDKLVELGTGFRTEEIVAVAPNVVAAALLAVRKLGRAPQGLALELLTLAVSEARELARLDLAHEQQLRDVASEIAGRREALKTSRATALRERRAVATHLLRNVLPRDAPQRAELERAAGKAATASSVVASVRTVARILADARRDESLVVVLDSYGYDDALVARLEALAAETERLSGTSATLTPPQAVDQRTLDRHDGLVLAILRAIVSALRDAQRAGAPISLPPLAGLERLLVPSRDDEQDDEEPEPVAPAS
ncbi:hypothetical protein [Sandaracinus amylolyticus]|uniref:Uncharacterized protein n=1 Tax=Sandaracinus amylolyticus TaxID=927083 RepID=A0A0F6W2K8_9BACT|nr:hypothetical protein [Sandaracinus amylolyticus]AKF05830.1 hypothetical protein DB32_002979 [Sandaracinus amylolyticus]